MQGYKWKRGATTKANAEDETDSYDRNGKKGKKGKKDKKEKKEDTCSHSVPRPPPVPGARGEQYGELLRPAAGCGCVLSTPYSYSCKRSPKDAEDQLEAAEGASHAAKKVHGAAFTVRAFLLLPRLLHNQTDWDAVLDAVPYGFALPEKWIRPVGEETAKMVAYLAEFVAKQARGKK
ncbi:hypothetical protein EVG20_g10282 [Dentipellis fragilis]|uniref:Uncharacterized protein n=1 Tax=Dentipellis fragilis TaxID=205917 RepID=A0A4Y9XUG5_9AGAM|nr:hypothetical protein EVG20_g10282 [Dentipellis fragilis]